MVALHWIMDPDGHRIEHRTRVAAPKGDRGKDERSRLEAGSYRGSPGSGAVSLAQSLGCVLLFCFRYGVVFFQVAPYFMHYKPLAVLLKCEHFLAMQEPIKDEE
jgi:hypothetical protein